MADNSHVELLALAKALGLGHAALIPETRLPSVLGVGERRARHLVDSGQIPAAIPRKAGQPAMLATIRVAAFLAGASLPGLPQAKEPPKPKRPRQRYSLPSEK
jgi:hypothetical protein